MSPGDYMRKIVSELEKKVLKIRNKDTTPKKGGSIIWNINSWAIQV